jgi:hypothetical protein
MGHYQRHLFFCTNDRGADADRPSCNRCGSADYRAYVKQRVKQMGRWVSLALVKYG